MAWFDHHGRQSLQQAIEGRPMNKVGIVEVASDAIELSPHITKNQRWRRTDHGLKRTLKNMAKTLLRAKRNKRPGAFSGLIGDAWAVKQLRNLVFAKVCILCDQPADDSRICGQCHRFLPWNDIFCACCGQAMLANQPPDIACAACQSRSPPFEKARAPLKYEFPVDKVIKSIKFRRQLWYVPALAELLLQTLRSEFSEVDALLPVPLHRWRQMTRGFNQAMELCRPLQKATGLPIITQAVRVRATSAQTGLNAAQRKKNLTDAFAVSGKLTICHPLIVDDVITTGETCSQLAVTLKEAGAGCVSVLTVARASGH